MFRNLRPLSLCMAISSALGFPVYASTTILTGETLENYGQIDNYDAIDVQGQLVNYGNIWNFGNVIPDTKAQFNNLGLTDNFGHVIFDYASELNNYGVFNNINTISLYSGAQIVNHGELNNDGTIYGSDNYNTETTSQIINASVLNNNGTIVTTGIVNQISGYIKNAYTSFIDMFGDINNAGTIDNYGAIRLYTVTNSFQLNNFGTINNNGNITGYNGSLNNSGVFNNGVNSFLDVSIINNSGTFNNDGYIFSPSMVIKNSGVFNSLNLEVDRIENYSFGIFNNSGMARLISLNNQGEFNNQNEMIFSGYGPASVLNNSGQFNNSGNISTDSDFVLNNFGIFNQLGSILAGTNIVMNNYGTFNNGSDISYGSGLLLPIGSVLNNYGTFNNINGLGAQLTVNNSGIFNSAGWNINDIRFLLNSGEMNLHDDSYVYNFINETSGIINNSSPGYMIGGLIVTDRFENKGTLNNTGRVLINSAYINGPAVNTGTINNNLDMYSGNPAGEININADFNNNGTINNNAGIWIAGGQLFSNFGDIFNNGIMIINQALNNVGEFNNSGSVAIHNYSGETANNSGTINNIADVSNMYFPFPDMTIDSDLNNTGTINNSVFAYMNINRQMTNSGALNNSGEMYIGNLYNQGAVNNKGLLTIRNDWQVINAGTINNQVDVPNFYMLPVINIESSIDNAGTINNAYAAEINMYGYWSNYNSGVIHNDGRIRISSELINSGVITGVGEFNGNLVITEAGTLAPGTMDPMLQGQGLTIAGNLDMDGKFAINIDGELPFYSIPQTNVYGLVTLGENSLLDISFYDGGYLWDGMTFDLMTAYNISGSFGSFTYDALFNNNLTLQWEILEGYGLGDLLRVSVVSSVPVPAAVWLFISGLAGLVVVSRRREKTMH